MGLVRLIIFGLIAMTAAYFLISVYSRSVRREKLEKQWAEDHPDGGDPGARDAYISKGMAEYHAGIRPKLIFLVYVIPVVLVAAIHILTTYT